MRKKPPARDALTDAGLVALIRAGDRPAAEILVVRWEPLVELLIGRLRTDAIIDHDDLRQLGRLAVLHTARTHPPAGWSEDGRASFKTYVFQAIRWALQSGIRGNTPRCLLEDGLPGVPSGEDAGMDGVAMPDSPRGDDLLTPLLSCLNPMERAVVRAIWGLDGVSGRQQFHKRTPNLFKDVAMELGISKSRVQRLHAAGMKKMKSLAARPD